jgi:hypothetical protein
LAPHVSGGKNFGASFLSSFGQFEFWKIEIGSKLNQVTASGILRTLFVRNCRGKAGLAQAPT